MCDGYPMGATPPTYFVLISWSYIRYYYFSLYLFRYVCMCIFCVKRKVTNESNQFLLHAQGIRRNGYLDQIYRNFSEKKKKKLLTTTLLIITFINVIFLILFDHTSQQNFIINFKLILVIYEKFSITYSVYNLRKKTSL